MTLSRLSTLLASGTLVLAGVAFAQGNPPTTAPANPATGAGQQSPTGGPMGTTGTTPQNTQSGSTMSSPPSTGSTGSSTMNTPAPSTDSTTMAANEPRPARADRN
ncbi:MULTISPECIES: proteophosphoglycan ppg4 [Variovorax]|uniref:Proteophosphoglycan ppg4 n=1 Tax=Variovorax paradoxus TaxID=34073 RepID=A0A5Q0MCQ0_VARPD|nr:MULTISPECIES: proteophosphoglycan ppg4 [Variovorax]QFZ86848.1 proteophosphoglycan ppg4 [Variovorax paradoxus]WPG39547.1 proteophosphoglycan ppg4 [Variovorax boronicumulans]